MAKSVLEERPTRIPVAGKIHGGIKRLTAAAAGNKALKEQFDRMLADGKGYDTIERALREAFKLEKSPLTPQNTPYFRVSRNDFGMPEMADLIMKLYATDRGDGAGFQLYRFPIILPMDEWLAVLPHGFKAYNATGMRYWSEYDAAGTRFCKELVMPEAHQQNQRALRAWGGRRAVLRADNGGRCDPNVCPQYQSRECGLSGRFLFYIPGIPGGGVIELGTTSIYSLQQMRSAMELVYNLRGGRLSGVHNGKPIFWLNKVQQEISTIDNGQVKRRTQFLINLEADIDVFGLMQRQELQALGQQPQLALAPPDHVEDVEEETLGTHTSPDDRLPERTEKAKLPEAVRVLRKKIFELVEADGADVEKFRATQAHAHGPDWSTDETKLKGILALLEQITRKPATSAAGAETKAETAGAVGTKPSANATALHAKVLELAKEQRRNMAKFEAGAIAEYGSMWASDEQALATILSDMEIGAC